jgi:hypothetical protein
VPAGTPSAHRANQTVVAVQRRTSTWRHSHEPKSLRFLQSVLESHLHRNCTSESDLAPTSCTNNEVRRKVMNWRIGCKWRRNFFHSQELLRNYPSSGTGSDVPGFTVFKSVPVPSFHDLAGIAGRHKQISVRRRADQAWMIETIGVELDLKPSRCLGPCILRPGPMCGWRSTDCSV